MNRKFLCVRNRLTVLMAAVCLVSSAAHAAMTPEDAARLRKDLTPIGAERAANRDVSIPAWDGGLTKAPANFDPKSGYADPFSGEKPLYTITAANAVQYKDVLSPGHLEMLKRYPSFKMNVYPTHRTAAFPEKVFETAKTEGLKAMLSGGGNGVVNITHSQIPFPVPHNGEEVLWNHLFARTADTIVDYTAEFSVQTNGSFTPVTRVVDTAAAGGFDQPEKNRLGYQKTVLTGPSNMEGDATLVIDPMDQVSEKRLAWTYNAGQRRVIRAPEFGYDQPGTGSDGLRTVDDFSMFNGALDRYDWKLIGKREMIIPYNNYRLSDKKLKYKDIIRPQHLNDDLIRYELHRVWVVEGTLKPGARHVYAKREFYVDEDSWLIAHGDQYDGRGQLWRVKDLMLMQAYDVPGMWNAGEVQYDLQAQRYNVQGLRNEERPAKFKVPLKVSDFKPDALRRMGD
ncbi:DUF1329 domain-containing protein [Burkholderia sp. BCC1977]|uniref:DUF1329 domain-containing protein n=1 Tax=Burkholderia sp. BCC1977 TaxID=2817440 RepID=UPI002ABDD179|nr:DUF1329 domain-containing protein [Burkholderia sp. BCC1977]